MTPDNLWSAADKLRANSDLKSSEYATPVLGLIFLKFADNNYRRFEAEIHAEAAVVSWIEGQAVGATMPNLNTGILERVPIFYPEDKVTQKKISATLTL